MRSASSHKRTLPGGRRLPLPHCCPQWLEHRLHWTNPTKERDLERLQTGAWRDFQLGDAGSSGPPFTSPLLLPDHCWEGPTYHVFDQQVSTGEGNRIGRRRDWQHEGIGAANCARDHQVQGVHMQSDGLAQRSRSKRPGQLEKECQSYRECQKIVEWERVGDREI